MTDGSLTCWQQLSQQRAAMLSRLQLQQHRSSVLTMLLTVLYLRNTRVVVWDLLCGPTLTQEECRQAACLRRSTRQCWADSLRV